MRTPAALPEENAGERNDLTGSNGPGGRQLPARAGTGQPGRGAAPGAARTPEPRQGTVLLVPPLTGCGGSDDERSRSASFLPAHGLQP
jgi:hypothetical protein